MTDIINGILAGLEDFIEGRCKHFKNDEELEEYLMELPDPMPIALLFYYTNINSYVCFGA